ncbi:MAG: DUF2971 domain-containing protein [Bacteroidetes bacterium]|nr:DUF2971 domain-containing protein [Bacteroidota bacterium]
MDAFFKYGDKYIEEVIRPLLPKANLGSFIMNKYYLFGPGQLDESIYERKFVDDSFFFHFTTISNLLEIIRSKTIRMSDFNIFSDEFELTYANNNLVENSFDFSDYKSCLFALSMCEESKENLNNNYLWENYGDNHKGACIRLKLDKKKSLFNDFYLGKIVYQHSKQILELEELKKRHFDFESKYGKAINNLDEILLTVCSMYKKATPFENEREVRLLAYIQKGENSIHTNCNHPIRHKYNSKKDLIEYFLELELEYEKETENGKNNYALPFISIDSVIQGDDCYLGNIGKLRSVIEYEFFDSFKRDIKFYKK